VNAGSHGFQNGRWVFDIIATPAPSARQCLSGSSHPAAETHEGGGGGDDG
jgi:hypothetical protein